MLVFTLFLVDGALGPLASAVLYEAGATVLCVL